MTSENTGALSEDRSKIDRNSDTDEESLLNIKVTHFLMTTIGRLKISLQQRVRERQLNIAVVFVTLL